MFNNHIFIISLKNILEFSKKRTEILEQRLKTLNFNLNNVNYVGVLGTKLIGKNLNRKYVSQEIYDFSTHIGTLGASLSHVLVLKLIQIKKLYGDILVFEEDAILNDNFTSILSKLPCNYDLTYLHSYWDINFYLQHKGFSKEIFFEKCKHYLFQKQKILINSDTELKIPEQIKFKFKNILFNKITNPPIYNTPSGIMVYAINGKNIDKIVNHILPIKQSADWHYLNQYENLNQYHINPEFKLTSNPALNESLRLLLDDKHKQYKKTLNKKL